MGRHDGGGGWSDPAPPRGCADHPSRPPHRGRPGGLDSRDPPGGLRLMGAAVTRTATIDRRLVTGPSVTRTTLVLGAGALVLATVVVVALAAGSVGISLDDTLGILGRRLLGLPLAETWQATDETIIFQLRLPRVLT